MRHAANRQAANGALCILAMTLVATVAGAAQMTTLEIADMAVEAETIAIGRCVEASSQWIDGNLMTLIRIEVEESLKGMRSEELTVVVPGGIDATRPVPISVTFPGAPVILPDEDVLLFLDHFPAVKTGHQILGFSQGRYSLIEDTSGGRLVTKGRHLSAYGKALEDVKTEIREALAGTDH